MDPRSWTFDIDRYLNPWVPCPPWRHVPYVVARFMGHRKPEYKPLPPERIMTTVWAFIGVFCGVSVLGVTVMHIPEFQQRAVPLLISSFGAAAVLEFYAIESPLAQPRNAIVGHIVSAVIGVSISKLFQLSPDFESLQWLGAALSCATATAFMGLTKTVHPPAGATAMMAVAEPNIVHLGWFLLPVVVLGITLMMSVALLVNNIARRFPVYWWTGADLSSRKTDCCEGSGSGSTSSNKEASNNSCQSDDGEGLPYHHSSKNKTTDMWLKGTTSLNGHDEPTATSSTIHTRWRDSADDEERDLERGGVVMAGDFQTGDNCNARASSVILRQGQLSLPSHLSVSPEEVRVLESICRRL